MDRTFLVRVARYSAIVSKESSILISFSGGLSLSSDLPSLSGASLGITGGVSIMLGISSRIETCESKIIKQVSRTLSELDSVDSVSIPLAFLV